MNAFATQFKMVASQSEMCPANCGRDRFDHDWMGNPCEAYLEHLRVNNPNKYERLAKLQVQRDKERRDA